MRQLRWILIPFSLLYGCIVAIRNLLFDINFFSSYTIPVKSIVVGNLSAGGTGKTPHVIYLAEELKGENNVAILSRGYGRKSKGFHWVHPHSTSEHVGDEPLMYARIFQDDLIVAVCESRKEGIKQILREFPETNLILLDDAYQHRKVKAGLTILLTEYNRPFYNDFLLPVGSLREWTFGKKRANLLIATKCPDNLDDSRKGMFIKSAGMSNKPIYFSSIRYKAPLSFVPNNKAPLMENVLLITGIANAQPLVQKLAKSSNVTHHSFGDHHDFTREEIKQILQKFDTFASDNKIILTTEKDYVRLIERSLELKLDEYPWYYLPISIQFDEEEKFKATINQYVRTV